MKTKNNKPKHAKQRIASLTCRLRNLKSWKIARANRDLSRAMKRDPDFAHTWKCNIAMVTLDGANKKLTHKDANEIADRLMLHLFNITN